MAGRAWMLLPCSSDAGSFWPMCRVIGCTKRHLRLDQSNEMKSLNRSQWRDGQLVVPVECALKLDSVILLWICLCLPTKSNLMDPVCAMTSLSFDLPSSYTVAGMTFSLHSVRMELACPYGYRARKRSFGAIPKGWEISSSEASWRSWKVMFRPIGYDQQAENSPICHLRGQSCLRSC